MAVGGGVVQHAAHGCLLRVHRCINADPNYGSMWFHCKTRPFDTAKQVLKRAKAILCCEIHLCRLKYATAAMKGRSKRVKAKLSATPKSPGTSSSAAAASTPAHQQHPGSVTVDSTDISEEEGVTDMLDVEEQAMLASVLQDGSPISPQHAHRARMKPSTVISTNHLDYATGFVSLSRSTAPGAELVKASDKADQRVHKRKLLFGSDLILP